MQGFPATASAWALATIRGPHGPRACVETASGLFDLAAIMKRAGRADVTSTLQVFENWDELSALLDAAGCLPEEAVEPAQRLAPILYPGKVLCAGANYFSHLREMNAPDLPKEKHRLFFFFKPSRNAVVGEGATVHKPLDTAAFDWEIELAAVIGRTARDVTPDEALDHVAGFTVGIDLTARDLNQAPETFYKLDWVAGKAHETCCPLGPRIVPAKWVGDPQAVRLQLSVNGSLRQDDSASDMIFPVAEQISIASRIMTLDPGDVVLTGTPAGVGWPKRTFLSEGDEIEASIGGIGSFKVSILPPKGRPRP